jgi:hypothetical protein
VRRHLVREGWDVNLKRVHRIWKKEGLRVRKYNPATGTIE